MEGRVNPGDFLHTKRSVTHPSSNRAWCRTTYAPNTLISALYRHEHCLLEVESHLIVRQANRLSG